MLSVTQNRDRMKMKSAAVGGEHQVEHDDAEGGSDRIEEGALEIEDRTGRFAGPYAREERADHGRA
jgi:hypothetical protein